MASTRTNAALIEFIRSHGGCVTAVTLCKHSLDIQTSAEAEERLEALVDMGAGSWGIWNGRVFVLSPKHLTTV